MPGFDNSSAIRIARAVRGFETPRRDNRTPGPGHHPLNGASLPIGQYPGQFYGNVAQNQMGFTLPFMHAPTQGPGSGGS